jgi:valyl-tRNA synthetase
VDSERELMMEDARSFLDGLWRMARLAQDAAESLDGRIEDEDLRVMAETVEVREVLERVQNLSLEISEELDAYQDRHG